MDRSDVLRFIRIASFLPTLAIVAVSTIVACLIVFNMGGWIGAAFLLLLGVALAIAVVRWGVSEQTRFAEALTTNLFVVLAFALLVALLLPAVNVTRCDGRRMECSNNLKQIALGLHYYHDTFKSFPSAYIEDPPGTMRHSWRTLVLRYVEETRGDSRYDFNSPWNSKTNLPLAAKSPRLYRCQLSKDPEGDTNYFAVVGPETVWPRNEPVAFLDILDGSSNTIAIVESHQTNIKWTEPRDLTFSSMDWQINGTALGGKISSLHPGGAQVAMGDGSVRFVSERIDPEVLRALITAQGGEEIDDNAW